MPMELQFRQLNKDQQEKYLEIILRNRNMYNDFLEFAEKRFQGENVRFLRTMAEIPWNGSTPISSDVQRGIFATYIRPDSFFQVNLDADKVGALKRSVDADAPADWGPAVNEIRRLLRTNFLITDFLADRERRAQAAR